MLSEMLLYWSRKSADTCICSDAGPQKIIILIIGYFVQLSFSVLTSDKRVHTQNIQFTDENSTSSHVRSWKQRMSDILSPNKMSD